MASGDVILFLWHVRLQFPVQHDLHLPLLSHVGGDVVPEPDGRFCVHVPRRWPCYDCDTLMINYRFIDFSTKIGVLADCLICKHAVFGPGVHNHAGLCLESPESVRSDEFLWAVEFPCPLFTLGFVGVFGFTRKFGFGGFYG